MTADGQAGAAADLPRAREAILSHVDEQDGPVENLRLLAVAVWSAELDARSAGPDDLSLRAVSERVRSTLLPRLAREGAIDYDRASETVAPGGPAE